MRDCKYPNCFECNFTDCRMENEDIRKMLGHRKKEENPELYEKEKKRKEDSKNLPHCNDCRHVLLVENVNGNGVKRLCFLQMRLIGAKVIDSPAWCKRRNEAMEQ